MNIKILVATHKKYWMPNDDVYLPIHVGREGKADLGYIGDNTGDNISAKNANYCELTGLYWAWKNLDCDYIGLCHYRRYFSSDSLIHEVEVYKNFNDINNYILKKENYEELLKDIDVILPKKFYFNKMTIYEHYKLAHNINDLDECYKIVCEFYPDYRYAFKKVMGYNSFYGNNMFVMKKECFNNYMQWLFKILFELEKRVDISEYDNYQARIYGFLSERLFNVWLEKNKLNIKEVKMLFIREVSKGKYYRHKIERVFK